MVNSVSSDTQSQPVTPSAEPSKSKSQPQPASTTDSVQISKAAQDLLAIEQEFRETSVQTAQEAAHGDLQAQQLLAREAAEKAESK
jgi:hypothetical protein